MEKQILEKLYPIHKAFDILILINLIFFVICIFSRSPILFSQTNDTSISFDEDIPLSLVSVYLF